jgi:alanine dehydrogenase
VIGAVLVPGARAPHVVTEDMVESMQPGAVIVDISIDQGGCVATSHVTTHADPTYVTHGVVHYCVGNMPGAVPHTSTFALTNVTVPYALRLASGVAEALAEDPGLLDGVNVANGRVTNVGVGEAHGLPIASPREVLGVLA